MMDCAELETTHATAAQCSTANAVKTLTLTLFRNHRQTHINTHYKSLILTGHNGAGKTNVLEALSLLSPGRGMRKARLREMTHAQEPNAGWVIAAQVMGHQGETHVGTGLDISSDADKRIVKLDGDKAKSQTELARHLSIIWQTPQMDGLFTDSNSARRHFLDRLVYNFDSEHVARVNAYDAAMRDRTKILQSYQRDEQWLHVLEQRMAEQGVAIAAARNALLDRLNESILASETGFPKAHLSLEGETEDALRLGGAAVDLEVNLLKKLQAQRPVDAAAGRALKGVHRTQLQVRHLIKNMEAAYCSTGEQKAMLLSILLAHARARAKWQGAAPILLLDEVVAHLDATRRKELFNEIESIGAQAWLTGTDVADFSAAEDYLTMKVAEGQIEPMS